MCVRACVCVCVYSTHVLLQCSGDCMYIFNSPFADLKRVVKGIQASSADQHCVVTSSLSVTFFSGLIIFLPLLTPTPGPFRTSCSCQVKFLEVRK